MQFLTPSWLLLGFLALPILILYMLKLRRREVQVSSTMLWQTLQRDRQANRPWQRLRKNILLILQLLILAALTLALARPSMQVPAIASGAIVVLLDASASMAAGDVKPNRFESARIAVSNLINNLDRGSKMTIIQVAREPRILAAGESDHDNLRGALAQAELTMEESNWQTAFALAASAVAVEGGNTTIVIVSDGGIPDHGLPPLPSEVRYIPIGTSASNLAISAFAVRQAGTGNELFVGVSNFGNQEREAVLSIYIDESLLSAQNLIIPPDARMGLSLSDYPAEGGILSARLTPSSNSNQAQDWDFLDLDNTAFAINQAVDRRRILLFSPGNFFLDQILSSFPNTQAFRALPEITPQENDSINFRLPEEPFELYIFDELLPTTNGVAIPDLPENNLLLINPPSNPLFSVTGIFTPTDEMKVNEHPLTQFLDWSAVHIRQARMVQTPVWAEILVDSPQGPLVFAGETGGRRVVVITFDLNDSDLPLQVAFPILFANVLEYLLPPPGVDPAVSISPGDGVAIQVASATDKVTISSPDGNLYSVSPTESGFFFPYTDQLGIYTIKYFIGENAHTDFFAVNLFSQNESSIVPSESIRVGRDLISTQQSEAVGLQEFWLWIANLGLIILVLEWLVYHRRLLLPREDWRQKILLFRSLKKPW
jgi:Ca-activated chloride channel homolog